MTAELRISLGVGGCTLALRRCGACCGAGGDGVVCLGWAPPPQTLQPERVLTVSMRHGASELTLAFARMSLLQLFADEDSRLFTRGNMAMELDEHGGAVHALLFWGDGDEMTPETLVRALVAISVEEDRGDARLPTAALRDWFCAVPRAVERQPTASQPLRGRSPVTRCAITSFIAAAQTVMLQRRREEFI